jgi:hypothetical protein
MWQAGKWRARTYDQPMRTTAALLLLAPFAAAQAAAPAPAPAAPGRARIHCLDGRTLSGQALVFDASKGRLAVGEEGAAAGVELADVLEASAAPAASTSGKGLPGSPAAPLVEAELFNRDLVRGLLVRGIGETGFVVQTAPLGEVEVYLDALASVRFPAGYARADDPPPLEPGANADRVIFATGDRLDGTLRTLGPGGITVRAAGGGDRTLKIEGLLGVALTPLPRKPEAGLRVQLALTDGSRISGKSLDFRGGSWVLAGTIDGKDRSIAAAHLAGLSVRGGRGTPLSDLVPAKVEVKTYWGDDPLAAVLRPRFDRAFTLDRGAPPPIRLGGREFLRGVSTFSGTTLTYDLSGKGFRTFTASVGVDDAGPKGAVVFEVLLDGKSAWKSGPVRALPAEGEPLALPALDVSAAKTLSLAVHAGPDDDVQDFADWVKAALIP